MGSVDKLATSGFDQVQASEETEENIQGQTYLIDKLIGGEKENLIRILLLLKQETPFLIEDKVDDNIATSQINESDAF